MTVHLTAFTKYDRMAASTRQRLLQYRPALEAAGIHVDHRPLLDNDYVASLASGAHYPARKVAAAYLRRLQQVMFGPLGDVVWVYAELFPFLPASFERLVAARGHPIVYDFDDAFFHTYDDHPNRAVRAVLAGKHEPVLRAASVCTCGNDYLRDYAARFCPNSIFVPTAVDTDVYRPERADARRVPVIGWIGSPSTWSYVRPLLPLLEQLTRDGRARLRVIGAGRAAAADLFSGMNAVEWSEKNEVADLQAMDIGIMPVPDEPWARGKSGYKLIQYMACGLPLVASPVGINRQIVRDGANGFLATNVDQWRQALETLLADSELRLAMGANGRERALSEYSLAVQAPRIVEVIKSAARR